MSKQNAPAEMTDTSVEFLVNPQRREEHDEIAGTFVLLLFAPTR